MSKDLRIGSHTVSWLTAHIVWVTKYRYKVLEGDIQKRCRDLVKQICDAEDIKILKGVVSKDHVHIHIEYRPSLNISDIVKRLKGRTRLAGCKKSIRSFLKGIGVGTSGQSVTEFGAQVI